MALWSFRNTLAAVATAAAALTLSGAALAEPSIGTAARAPLAFPTVEEMPAGALAATIGANQTYPSAAPGSGIQLYYGSFAWAPTEDLTFRIHGFYNADPPINPIAGQSDGIIYNNRAASVEWSTGITGNGLTGVVVSLEDFLFRTRIFNQPSDATGIWVGSLYAPFRYSFTPDLDLWVAPGVSVYPDTFGGFDYYGTIASVGIGLEARPIDRWRFAASINGPVLGGNVITSSQAIERVPVYRLAVRYETTPRTALEGYMTNSVGVTPATQVLALWPDGDVPFFGLVFNYTPSASFARNFENARPQDELRFDRRGEDGRLLSSASVLPAGSIALRGYGGSHGENMVGVSITPDLYFQMDGYLSTGLGNELGDTPQAWSPELGRYMVGGRLQLFDQSRGDPIDLTPRVLGGRDTEANNGALYFVVSAAREVREGVSITVQPSLGLFSENELWGLGLGGALDVTRDLSVHGEVMPVLNGSGTVWATAARYRLFGDQVMLDLSATNSLGDMGYDTLVAGDETRFTFGLRLATNVLPR